IAVRFAPSTPSSTCPGRALSRVGQTLGSLARSARALRRRGRVSLGLGVSKSYALLFTGRAHHPELLAIAATDESVAGDRTPDFGAYTPRFMQAARRGRTPP